MNKKLRFQVYNKYNGLCAYTGTPLDDDWQVDHIIPQFKFNENLNKLN
jgi:5-methylcytosine-specific restriction endonuclease McrA